MENQRLIRGIHSPILSSLQLLNWWSYWYNYCTENFESVSYMYVYGNQLKHIIAIATKRQQNSFLMECMVHLWYLSLRWYCLF